MFKISNKRITMNEGDYGEKIIFNVTSGNILETDTVLFVIENKATKEDIISKEMTISENKLEVALSQEESLKLKKEETYLWGILQKRDGMLVDTLEINNSFEVVRGLA